MKIDNLEKMIRGWFVGNFEPSVLKTDKVEVGVKSYKAGDYEDKHFHKVATEITVIIYGEVEMNGIRYKENDIIIIEPNDVTDFRAITDCKNVVVKIPGVSNDKFLV